MAMALCALWVGWAGQAFADAGKLRVGFQYGLTYLAFMVMEHEHLVEAEAKKMGLGDVEVTWIRTAGGPQLNDALLSGSIDLACTGATSFLTLWDKSRGKLVRAMFGYGHMPFTLVTRRPDVKTVADFTDKDRIALPAVGSSTQAIYLQMAAEKAFGPQGIRKLDPLTVSRSHPDGMAALLSNTEITAHFTAPPYADFELAVPGMHKVMETEDVVGQPVSNGLVYTTEKFYAANPNLLLAFRKALEASIALINTDRLRAAQIYKAANPGDKTDLDMIVSIIGGHNVGWEITPLGTMITAQHLKKIGQIQTVPADWKELFFPIVYDLPGN
ncbi:ABC transporter substrate-binding protein [Aquabacter sp. CN5-332]